MGTVLPIFNDAGIPVSSIDDILAKGIYITTATKTPKVVMIKDDLHRVMAFQPIK